MYGDFEMLHLQVSHLKIPIHYILYMARTLYMVRILKYGENPLYMEPTISSTVMTIFKSSHSHINFSGKKHMNEFTTEDYKKYKQEQNLKVHGWFLMGKPTLSINDVDIIKQIQVSILYV